MKGKITKQGILAINRASVIKRQYCFLTSAEYCSDSCSLFGEPCKKEHSISGFDKHGIEEYRTELSKETYLSLCKKTLTFDYFVDERIEKKL